MTVPLRSLARVPVRTRIPGSDVDVELIRLHLDRDTRATVSLVRFPQSWRRPGTGYYPCAEELLVVDGAITVSGITYSAGDYGYLPPHTTRTASATPDGCVALAWFSGVPSWIAGAAPPDLVTHTAVHGAPGSWTRLPRPDVPGSSCVVDGPPLSVDAPTELLFLDGWYWSFVLPGTAVPARSGPVFVRRWA